MPCLFNAQPLPKSRLGSYRQLATTAGVHVSPIVLGAMSIGSDAWEKYGCGEMNREQSYNLLNAYFDLGGNFIDTANFFQDETSEQVIGEWAEERGIRDQLFIATKYAGNAKHNDDSIEQKVLYGGTNLKSMRLSLENSLNNLRTSYVDLFYVHWWDYNTTIPELMNGLHALVTSGKVLYLGISDTPAWVVAKANQFARDHGLTPFSVYQGLWNVLERSFERDIIPMARDEGMALVPWGVLAQGKIRTDEEEERRRISGEKGRVTFNPEWERTEDERKVCRALEEVARDIGATSITSVAIAYLMHKTRYVFPIVGGRKVEHLEENLEALDIALKPEQIAFIEGVVPFNPGFPNNLIGNGSAYVGFHYMSGHLQRWPDAKPIVPVFQ